MLRRVADLQAELDVAAEEARDADEDALKARESIAKLTNEVQTSAQEKLELHRLLSARLDDVRNLQSREKSLLDANTKLESEVIAWRTRFESLSHEVQQQHQHLSAVQHDKFAFILALTQMIIV